MGRERGSDEELPTAVEGTVDGSWGILEVDNMEGREVGEDEQVGSGQKENGEMIKYCAPNSAVLTRPGFPSQPVLPKFDLLAFFPFIQASLLAWQHRRHFPNHVFACALGKSSRNRTFSFSPSAEHFLSPLPFFVPPVRHSKRRRPASWTTPLIYKKTPSPPGHSHAHRRRVDFSQRHHRQCLVMPYT